VGPRHALFAAGVEIAELNWLVDAPDPGTELRVQLRYRASDVPATVVSRNGAVELALQEEVAAVTPGQSAVFFQDERVLGGGRIVRAWPATGPER